MIFILLLVLCAIFTALPILHLFGRGTELIIGYSSLNKEARAKHNEQKTLRTEALYLIIIDLTFIYVTLTYHNPSPVTSYVAAFGIIFSIAHSICNRIKFK